MTEHLKVDDVIPNPNQPRRALRSWQRTLALHLCMENLLIKRAISANNFHIRKGLLLESSIIYNKG